MIRRFALMKSEVQGLPYSIDIEPRMVFNPELKSAYNFLPGTIAMILLLISAMLTSLTIAREKETGTMEILLVSPVSPLTIILGKIGPYAILSFINAVLILLIGYFVFEVPVKGSLPLLLAMCILYVVTSLSLGILISNKSKTQQAAMMGSLISLMMPSMLLSGFIFPISSMPVILQYISKIVPTTYFIMIIKAIMLRGAELHHIMHPMLVLLLMTSVFLIISLKLFKTRLS
jgi:ABC-2 type transport system permease protein